MSGSAVDKLDLEGGLTNLSAQIAKVKGQKTSKLNLFRRGIERFEDDLNNLEIWKALQVLKEKADDCGENFTILTEACVAKMREERNAWAGVDAECPMAARHDAAMVDLEAYEKDKERLDSDYFRLAGGVHKRENSMVVSEVKADVRKVKPADTLKPDRASLKLTPSEFQVWAAKATGWVQESNFMLAEVNVQHLYLNAILDREVQQKVETLPEYAAANSPEVIKLVEQVHNAANPLFVKRSNFYAAHRGNGETGSVYIARVKVLADLAKLSDMDQMERVKFKVLRDLPAKVRE